MEQKNENGFRYTYSAREQAELKKIREKYTEKAQAEEDKMEKIRRLDRRVTKRAQCAALILGILGALVMGTGMSLAMTELASHLGVAASVAMPLGIGIGLVGILLAAVAYPVYQTVIRHERARIAPEILRLTEELLK